MPHVNFIHQIRRSLAGGAASDVFLSMMLAVTVIAASAHLIFIFLFDSAGVPWMARANMVSVLMYVLTAWLLKQGHNMTALTFVVLEIILHAITAVVVIGWGSGFHYYIILIIPVAVLSSLHKPAFKAVFATGVGVLYLLLDHGFRQAVPIDALKPALLSSLHYFNLASTLMILGLLSMVYYRLVVRADARLRHQACTDPLTQLRNRRFAMEVAQHEAAVYQRGGRPLVLVLGDIDHFKQVNDRFGHEMGDTALKAVAQVLRNGVREVDHVARWGGEEFLMLLPATDEAEALRVSERLRGDVERLNLAQNGQPVPLTLTLGISLLAQGETVEHALARADRAMYSGKQDGRNRVVLAEKP